MGQEPKIKDVIKLRECYIDKKMSTTAIAADSESLLGVKVSPATVYQTLIREDIPLRSMSESISIATATLDREVSFLDHKSTDWIDGFLLGDGSIAFRKGDYMGARFTMGSPYKEWIEYGMKGLSDYGVSEPKMAIEIGESEKNPNGYWYSRTFTHPDIVSQAKRWYPDGTKHVPEDVVISPCSVLLWYLGDGSFNYDDSNCSRLRFATCAFAVEEIENILIPKLKALGLDATRHHHKNDVYIRAQSIKRFFSLIGTESPLADYAKKFDIPSWLFLHRLSDFVHDPKERHMVNYWVRLGKVEHTRSPGGKLMLFTDDQRDALLRMLADR
jgi:hypothetical protein